MKIYLDGMFYRCSGVGRIFENLLSAFLDDGGFREIHTVVPEALRTHFVAQFPRPEIRARFVGYGPMTPGDLLGKALHLRSLRGTVGKFLFPGHNVPLFTAGDFIVGVNDLTVFSPYFRLPRYRKVGFRRLLGSAIRRAQRVVTISETVKADIVREFSVPPGKVIVIYPWVRELFLAPPPEAPLPGSLRGKEFLLYLGLRIPHKNVEGLIRAFLLLLADFPELTLAVAGNRYETPDRVDRWKHDCRLRGRLVEIFDPSDEEIAGLFRGAKAFVFPSFAEGFGLPPLEAMASGVPVVCSDIPVFREVYGDAVRYVDPASPDSIAGGIREILSDADFARRQAQRGRERAATFRRERSLAGYLELLR
jgi:glycosyltransferase involved in cell wall biosynthesis